MSARRRLWLAGAMVALGLIIVAALPCIADAAAWNGEGLREKIFIS